MFLIFPRLFARFGLWLALTLSAITTAACFGALAVIVKSFGIRLL